MEVSPTRLFIPLDGQVEQDIHLLMELSFSVTLFCPFLAMKGSNGNDNTRHIIPDNTELHV